jgi:hypothetical protein
VYVENLRYILNSGPEIMPGLLVGLVLGSTAPRSSPEALSCNYEEAMTQSKILLFSPGFLSVLPPSIRPVVSLPESVGDRMRQRGLRFGPQIPRKE